MTSRTEKNEDQKINARLDRVHRLRLATEDRVLARWERQEKAAAPMIGELIRDGRTVYYVFPVGGKYVESSSHTALVEHLAKKGYIR